VAKIIEGCFTLWLLSLEDLGQTSLERTSYKSIKIYKLWSLYKLGKKSLYTWFSINIADRLSSTRHRLGAKNYKKCCHVCALDGVVLWPLVSSVKIERTNVCSPPITLLESFICLTDSRSAKHS
jgi:hypothetical protein